MPESPVQDPHYALLTIVQKSLEWIYQMETYIQDAEKAGDQELAEWFRKIQEGNRKAGEQGRELLKQRLQTA